MLIDRLKYLCHIEVSIQNKSIKICSLCRRNNLATIMKDVEELTFLIIYYLKSGNVNFYKYQLTLKGIYGEITRVKTFSVYTVQSAKIL